ncbi:MAG: hypothetical protein J5701_04220 [Bacteroidales bacterium]|nr:hypothetical protein [Bacteroidales bacterium]
MPRSRLPVIFACSFLLTCFYWGYGQNYTIQNIILSGNHRTKEYVILRELTFRTGDTLNMELLDKHITQSKQNLLNASLFNWVDISYTADNQNIIIYINVEEQWYWIPVLHIRTAEGNFNTWWQSKPLNWHTLTFGMELTDYNFLGRKHQVSVTIHAGYDNLLNIKYIIPYVNKKKTIGIQMGAGFNISRKIITAICDYRLQPLRSHKVIRYGGYAMAGIIWRPKHHFTWENNISYYIDNYNDTIFQEQNDFWHSHSINYFQLYTKAKWDYRDYSSYPLKGFYADIILEKNGLFIPFESVNTLYAQVNGRYYTPIVPRFYFGAGISLFSTFNTRFPITIGKFINSDNIEIRGLYSYLIPADNMILLKTNFKIALLEPTFIRIRNWDPRIGHLSFACYWNIFFDIMYYTADTDYLILNKHEQLAPWQQVLGMGLDLVTSYDKVFRFETSYSFQVGKLFYGISFKTAI